jgi:hypothetical protein
MLKSIVGAARAFSILLAIFLLIVAPIEYRATREAQTWEPRRARVTRSELTFDSEGSQTLTISLQDQDDATIVPRARVRYGGFGLAFYALPFWSWTSMKADQTKYPVGMELTAYRNPRATGEYVLEQNSATLMLSLIVGSALWLAWNAYLAVGYARAKNLAP